METKTNTRASTTYRKVGRPKKEYLKTGQQFSVRLTQKSKTILDISTKLKDKSLSGTIDDFVLYFADSYQLDGGSLLSAIEKKEFDLMEAIKQKLHTESADIVEVVARLNNWRIWLWTDYIGKLLLTPSVVLSEQEKNLANSLRHALLGITPENLAIIEPDLFTKVSADVNAMLSLGAPKNEIISHIKKYLSDNIN